jgi:WhiB family redox-sensing transcriptional regulator
MASVVLDGVDRRLPACSDAPDLHYPELLGRGRSAKRRFRVQVAQAKAMCAACPGRVACLTLALANREPDGIWGGLTPEERDALLAATAERDSGVAA